jgi:hypothetical protein
MMDASARADAAAENEAVLDEVANAAAEDEAVLDKVADAGGVRGTRGTAPTAGKRQNWHNDEV